MGEICPRCQQELANVCFSRFCGACGWQRLHIQSTFEWRAKWIPAVLVLPLTFTFAGLIIHSEPVFTGSLLALTICLFEWFRCRIGLRKIRELPEPRLEEASKAESNKFFEEVGMVEPTSKFEMIKSLPKPRNIRMKRRGWIAAGAGILGPIVIAFRMVRIDVRTDDIGFVLFTLILLMIFPFSITIWTIKWLQGERKLLRFGEVALGTIIDSAVGRVDYCLELSGGSKMNNSAKVSHAHGTYQTGLPILVFYDPHDPKKQVPDVASVFEIVPLSPK